MKTHSFFYLFIALLITSCIETNKRNLKKTDYYSTRIDTTYSIIDRTEISGIDRTIYEKHSNNHNKSLTFGTKLKGYNANRFFIIRTNISDLKDIKSKGLFFNNISEIKSLFDKIDSLGIGKSLKERKNKAI